MRIYQVVRQVNGVYRVESKADEFGIDLRVELDVLGNRVHPSLVDAIAVARIIEHDEYERLNPPVEEIVWTTSGAQPAPSAPQAPGAPPALPRVRP